MTQDRTRAADEKFCGACAKIINKAAVSCPNCGAPQGNSATAQTTAPPPPAQPSSVNVNVNQNTNQDTDIDNPKGQSERVILGAGEKHCSSCGSVVKIVAEICPSCGVRQNPIGGIDPNATSEKNFVVALLCLVLLGWIGGHRFYVGKPGTAILFLLTWGGMGIWGLWDLIALCTGKFTDSNGLPIQA